MGFGGSVAAMIASLKANARPKRNPFDKEVKGPAQAVRKEFLREACPDDLQRIRRKMTVQRAREHRVLIGILVAPVVLVALFFLLFVRQDIQWGWSPLTR